MELDNITALIIAGTAMASVTVTTLLLWTQIRQSSKIASADLSLRLLDTIRNKDFREILSAIHKKNTKGLNDDQIYRVLNHYEYLALFEQTKLLNFEHVLHQHGRNIEMLYNDPIVKNLFMKSRDEDSGYNYAKLYKLFTKIIKNIPKKS